MTIHWPAKLLVVGDSIALGATVVFGKQIIERAAPNFIECLQWRRALWTIDTDAAVHRTTVQTVPLLPRLLTAFRPDIVLFILGGSDADMDWRRFIASRGQQIRSNTSLETFRTNLRTLVDTAVTGGAVPLLSDVPSQDVVRRGEWISRQIRQDVLPWIQGGGGQAESDRRLMPYNDAVNEVASEAGVTVTRWAAALSKLPLEQRFGPDATHPSTQAHAIITEVAEQSIDAIAETIAAKGGRRIAGT